MSDFGREYQPTINFNQLDRQTVFKIFSQPNAYFIRADIRHCKKPEGKSCNHVCAVFPNHDGKSWDIRWLIDKEMSDDELVEPIGTVQAGIDGHPNL